MTDQVTLSFTVDLSTANSILQLLQGSTREESYREMGLNAEIEAAHDQARQAKEANHKAEEADHQTGEVTLDPISEGKKAASQQHKQAVQAAAEPDPEPTQESQEALSVDQVRNAAMSFANDNGVPALQKILADNDVGRVSDIPEDKLGPVFAAIKEAHNG